MSWQAHMPYPIKVLIFAQHTSAAASRSGIQRVVIESALALGCGMEIDFVKWDAMDGQLRYLDQLDLKNLLPEDCGSTFRPHPQCHRVHYRFGDSIDHPQHTWILFPEIPYHLPEGNEIFARIISQCREYGIKTAAIFYDLIPIRDAEYQSISAPHVEYAIELLRCDLLFPISRFSGDDLYSYYKTMSTFSESELGVIRSKIAPVPLGECRDISDWCDISKADFVEKEQAIVLLGTVEPRKQQTRFLRAFNDALKDYPHLRTFRIDIFGSLHPASANDLYHELKRNPKIKYHQYSADADVELAFSRAMLSVFPSRSEGYGLPIVESLLRGVPCITANFGSMAEVAQGGGCLLVDVMSDADLIDGLVRLTTDPKLLASLRQEIPHRKKRSWKEYANDIRAAMRGHIDRLESERNHFAEAVELAVRNEAALQAIPITFLDTHWRVVRVDAVQVQEEFCSDRATGNRGLIVVVDLMPEQFNMMPAPTLAAVARADIVILKHGSVNHLVDAMHNSSIEIALTPRILSGLPMTEMAAHAAQHAVQFASGVVRARSLALDERLLGKAACAEREALPAVDYDLAIVISTFNRGPFVELNVEWLLKMLKHCDSGVRLVVVDNASTDDTEARLRRFTTNKLFTYIRNPANTGMLGNLRVCASLTVAKFIWLVGDDDFIAPGAINRLLNVLRSNPRLPLLSCNFGVYYRQARLDGDSPGRYFDEAQLLSRSPAATGMMRINSMAAQHDNLFTAIYPLIFRSDILAACFNYPFSGVPFKDLVESVPTSKMILGSLQYCDGYWFAERGVVGNAHNSWSHHRPRWHLVLMPGVFDLARDAGVDEGLIWRWTQLHFDLFDEAARLAEFNGVSVHVEIPQAVKNGYRVFGRMVRIPPGMVCVSSPPPPLWK